MHATVPTCVLDRDCHWAFQSPTLAIDEAIRSRRTGQSKEEGDAHIDKQDAPDDLPDSKRYCDARVSEPNYIEIGRCFEITYLVSVAATATASTPA